MAKSPGGKRLGKGLGALLPDEDLAGNFGGDRGQESGKAGGRIGGPGGEKSGPEERETDRRGGEIFIPIDKIRANPRQPRKRFDEEELAELAASIKQYGVVQPIIVDQPEKDVQDYVIIAGERRCRAAKRAGLTEIPVVIRNYSSEKRLEVALIENIHRQDLNPIEEALAYEQIIKAAGLSHEEVASRVGKNRSTVANALRLLKLPARMQQSLEDGSLSAGHARAILSVSSPAGQEKLYGEIFSKDLSVRAAENRALELGSDEGPGKTAAGTGKKAAARDPQLKAMENRFIEKLGTRVTVNGDLKKGRIEIEYYSMDDLDRLYGLLGD